MWFHRKERQAQRRKAVTQDENIPSVPRWKRRLQRYKARSSVSRRFIPGRWHAGRSWHSHQRNAPKDVSFQSSLQYKRIPQWLSDSYGIFGKPGPENHYFWKYREIKNYQPWPNIHQYSEWGITQAVSGSEEWVFRKCTDQSYHCATKRCSERICFTSWRAVDSRIWQSENQRLQIWVGIVWCQSRQTFIHCRYSLLYLLNHTPCKKQVHSRATKQGRTAIWKGPNIFDLWGRHSFIHQKAASW